MSSELAPRNTSGSPRLPRTAVPLGIEDPVVAARTELQAALSAIEEKLNVPKRAKRASVKAQLFARRKPAAATAAVVAIAAAVGGLVWLGVEALTNPNR